MVEQNDAPKIVSVARAVTMVLATNLDSMESIMVCLALVHQKFLQQVPTDEHKELLDYHSELVLEGLAYRKAHNGKDEMH
jgi:hypothetical protein